MVGQPERQRAGRSGAFNKSCSEVIRMFLTPVSSITSLKMLGQPERDGEGGLEASINPAAGTQDAPDPAELPIPVSSITTLKTVSQPERWRVRSGAFSKSCRLG
ncbi:uncharacterized protein [Chiloscyllium punctatum]|uniref:uncharacterized protein n=1 Tax=Chiloscyllium punctatum TaxID=137246 RepID=UPI003B634D45